MEEKVNISNGLKHSTFRLCKNSRLFDEMLLDLHSIVVSLPKTLMLFADS